MENSVTASYFIGRWRFAECRRHSVTCLVIILLINCSVLHAVFLLWRQIAGTNLGYLCVFRVVGIKPFVCLICNTTFTRQHSLNYHMLIHKNLNRFTCKECGRMFRHPSHFKVRSSPSFGTVKLLTWGCVENLSWDVWPFNANMLAEDSLHEMLR